MSVFRQATYHGRCDRCRTLFDPMHGGVCPSCKRVLCGSHLYGSWVRRLVGQLTTGEPRPCPECRRGLPPRSESGS